MAENIGATYGQPSNAGNFGVQPKRRPYVPRGHRTQVIISGKATRSIGKRLLLDSAYDPPGTRGIVGPEIDPGVPKAGLVAYIQMG